MATYMLEIGLEEMPAHLVTSSEKQLVKRVSDFLDEHRLAVQEIKPFSTPRRLAVELSGLADGSESISEVKRGPAIDRAKDDEGNWSKAAQGFARGQGTTPEGLTEKDGYLWAEKEIPGVPAKEILSQIGQEVVEQMTFTTYMKWGNHSFHYIRPIRWLVSLLDAEVVPFSVLDVKAGQKTRGHRFLSTEDVTIPTANDYAETLKKAYVMADAKQRKQTIVDQLKAIAEENKWDLDLDSDMAKDLLEEVNNIVEWPTAFSGNFDEKYLKLPKEVLITSMRDHQRFFFVTNDKGDLLPHFLSVRNGNAEYIDNVARGNEKVLVARLEDAAFFYKEDQQKSIADYMERVKKLVFHEKIGTVYEHMERVSGLAAELADTLALPAAEKADLNRASQIYKFDLMTGMVGEFDELQGVMGEHYAKLFGEKDDVAKAIYEHYLPTSANGPVAKSRIGAILAIADKLDSIVTFFAHDMMPSGANDPYGLRRAATGVVRTLEAFDWHFDLLGILTSFKEKNGAVTDANLDLVLAFLTDRVRKQALDAGIRKDIVAAATTNVITGDYVFVADRTKVLSDHSTDGNFRDVMESLSRVVRLAKKAPVEAPVDEKLLVNDQEKALYQATKNLTLADLKVKGAEALYEALASLQAPIAAYFDHTMVNDDDEAIKNNRYAQLGDIKTLIDGLGNIEEIVIK
ncbi:glycine--tRNA ligase subunit beta [Fructobacillus sp. M1-13]|uniref:Glycine--tRNA ligase beta subunit n=1 Tax=Fructobacillus papyriferae TaxID=2713171 RepID=A0ABS5QNN7_9LACO|nr:glycine--tRNA ligase subunit beta [Fructobacillus papyriferae]MBS9334749.1 glycine--tRNA ligase subunit beta [Fructobacillus papyriferae]MCD2158739.1 glycine--tRNA ligase subunit beta [Fructobacillus papyriferae]